MSLTINPANRGNDVTISSPTFPGVSIANAQRISGYRRADGQVGIRNTLLILFTVVCAEEISRRIAYGLEDAVIAVCRDCNANIGARAKMVRLAANPNVGAVL